MIFDFPYQYEHLLESADVDHTQTLRPTTINRLLQEIAWKHAKSLGVGYDQEDFRNLYWVLVRLDFQITGTLPKWGDRIGIKTRPAGYDKLYAYREFLLISLETQANGQTTEVEFCRATSTWVIIHQISRKLKRPDSFLSHQVPAQPPRLIEDRAPKLSRFEYPNSKSTFEVNPGYNEVDLHHHVNNVVYLQWFLQSLRKELVENWTFTRVILNFTEESFWGDTLEISSSFIDLNSGKPLDPIPVEMIDQSAHLCSYHQAYHTKTDPGISCLGTIYWKPRTLLKAEKEATLHQHAHQ